MVYWFQCWKSQDCRMPDPDMTRSEPMNNKAVRFLTILFGLLTLLVVFPSIAAAAVEWPVPAYGQRYAFKIPSDINPYSTAENPVWITTTDNS